MQHKVKGCMAIKVEYLPYQMYCVQHRTFALSLLSYPLTHSRSFYRPASPPQPLDHTHTKSLSLPNVFNMLGCAGVFLFLAPLRLCKSLISTIRMLPIRYPFSRRLQIWYSFVVPVPSPLIQKCTWYFL